MCCNKLYDSKMTASADACTGFQNAFVCSNVRTSDEQAGHRLPVGSLQSSGRH